MQIYEITGAPIAWMRAGRKGSKYYDKQVKDKERVYWEIKSAIKTSILHKGPVEVTLEFHMPIPKSWSLIKKKNYFQKPHFSRPDLDNLIKFVNDSLNRGLWEDDALIYEIHARKIYSFEPKTRIYVEPYEEERLNTLLPLHTLKV